MKRFDCRLVEVTGGEPLLQPAVLPLMRQLCDAGYEVLLETGGGLDISKVDSRVHRVLDVKCPGSGELEGNHFPNLDLLTSRDEVKFVVADRLDYRTLVSVRPRVPSSTLMPTTCRVAVVLVPSQAAAAPM